MDNFKGTDYYDIDSLLSDEERLIRDTVRQFVSEKLMPGISEHYKNGTFPLELKGEMAEMGFFGVNLPEKYGCPGLNNVIYGLICQELERCDSGIRSFVSVQGSLVMYPIYAYGSEEQKLKFLPKLASGEFIGCFGLTEPDFGSNPGGMITRAKKDGDSWILNGAKMWITNGTIADLAIVWAKTDEGIKGFIVEKGTPGYSTNDIKGKMSLRASITSELVFDNCKIPLENILPESHGLKSPLSCLTQARFGIAWGVVGSAMACFDEAVNYAKERIQFGKPIASFQLVQRKLTNMLTEITKAQLLVYQLGRLKDEGKATTTRVSLAKRNNVKVALEIARATRDILGAAGITDEYSAMRHMANLESVFTYEGTHDMHTLIVGRDITGIGAFE